MTNIELIHYLRGILSSNLSDEHKIRAVRVKITQAAPAKRGPYKMLKVTEDFAAYLRKYRQDRVAQGVCTCCGGINTDRRGKALCGDCLKSAKETAKARNHSPSTK